MEQTYLCSGVDWRADAPVLSLHQILPARSAPTGAAGQPGGEQTAAGPTAGERTAAGHTAGERTAAGLPLAPGVRVAFEIAAEGRFCLGFHRVHDRDERTLVPCEDQLPAERGYQCGRCFAQDDLRFMHDFHRSGIAPAGLKRYLDQPHWLYVATFADGASKVGTASHLRKQARLVEQGAVLAQYVAYARDGRVVRILEDEVTRSVGLQQAVRSGAKAAALCAPLPAAQLQDINDGFALAARGLLAGGIDVDGFEVVREEFVPPAADVVLGHSGLQPYPESLGTGRHGFTIREVLGPSALVSIDGSALVFVADLAQLKGRRLAFGDFATGVPAVQESLF